MKFGVKNGGGLDALMILQMPFIMNQFHKQMADQIIVHIRFIITPQKRMNVQVKTQSSSMLSIRL